VFDGYQPPYMGIEGEKGVFHSYLSFDIFIGIDGFSVGEPV